MNALITEHVAGTLFISGCVANQGLFYSGTVESGTVEPLLRAGATAQIDTAQCSLMGWQTSWSALQEWRPRTRLFAVWSQDRSAHESFSFIDSAWSMLRLPGENLGKPLCGRFVLWALQGLRDGRCNLCCC